MEPQVEIELQEQHADIDIGNISDNELEHIVDDRGYSLLMQSAGSGNDERVRILIERGADINRDVNGETAASLAASNGHYKIVLSILKSNGKFPSNYSHETVSNELKTFTSLCREMHEKVINCNEDESESFESVKLFLEANIERNPNLRYFYDTDNNSLLKTSIISKKFKIYKILLSKNIFLANHELMSNITMQLTTIERKTLKNINDELSHSVFTEEMMILMRNCKFGRDNSNQNQNDYMEFVRKAFCYLFSDPLLAIILKIVSAYRDFTIIFDFNRDSVEFLDPSSEPYMNGLFYLNGKIYVAAMDMLNPNKSIEIFSVLIHELCHFALFLVFDNYAKPYEEDDEEGEINFQLIAGDCEANQDGEEIVQTVFECYTEEAQHAELIVRIPQMIALYKENMFIKQEKLRNFSSLYQFYVNVCIPRMETELPNIVFQAEMRSQSKFLKARKKISILTKLIIVISFICFLITPSIYFILYEPYYTWGELNKSQKNIVKNATVNVFDTDLLFGELFNESSSVYSSLSSHQIAQALKGNAQLLNEAISKSFHYEIFLMWQNSTKKLKEKFLKSNVNFQGIVLPLFYVLSNDTGPLFHISSNAYKNILLGDTLYIGDVLKSNLPFLVERNFTLISSDFYINDKYDLIDLFENKSSENVNTHYTVNNAKDDSNEKFGISLLKAIEEAFYDRIFILSDGPGTGKSAIFHYMAEVTKQIKSHNWVSFIVLRNKIKFFEENFKTKTYCLDELVANILDIKSFELALFKRLFLEGKVVLLWDGFDEVNNKYNDFLINLFRQIKETSKNTQFLSTRPEYEIFLCEHLKAKTYKLLPFDKYNRNIYFATLLKHLNVSENFDKVMERINDFTEDEQENTYIDNFNNPIMFNMVADAALDSDIKEYKNRFLLYENFISKRLRSIGEFRLQNAIDARFAITDIHQIYALKFVVQKRNYDFSVNSLDIMNYEQTFSKNFVVSFGLMTLIKEGNIEFIHKTFAEFFVAKYLVDKIYNLLEKVDEFEMELRIKVLIGSIYFENQVESFLRSFLESNHTSYKWNSKNVQTLKSVISKKFTQVLGYHYENPFADLKEQQELIRQFFKKEDEVLEVLLCGNKSKNKYEWLQNEFNISVSNISVFEFDNSQLIGQEYLQSQQLGNILYNIWFNHKEAKYVVSEAILNYTHVNLPIKLDEIKNFKNFVEFFDKVCLNLTEEEQFKITSLNFFQIFFFELRETSRYSFFWNIYIKYSKVEDIAFNLKLKTIHKENFLHILMLTKNVTDITYMFKEIEKYLPSFEIKILIKSVCCYNYLNPVSYMCQNSKSNSLDNLNVYWNFIEKYLNKEDQEWYAESIIQRCGEKNFFRFLFNETKIDLLVNKGYSDYGYPPYPRGGLPWAYRVV